MTASKAQTRYRVVALRCASLADAGMTTRTIAAIVDKRPDAIKALIVLGRRLRALEAK